MSHRLAMVLAFLLLSTQLSAFDGGDGSPPTAMQAAQPRGQVAAAQAGLKKKPAAQSYIRLRRDTAGEAIALETAVVQFGPRNRNQPGPTVALYAAIHVADRAYYEQLNREFARYDAVLYELVAKQNTRPAPEKSAGAAHPVAMLQMGLKGLLDLDYQLDRVDYKRRNMIHADMTPAQLADSMSRRGESVFTMLFRAFGYSLAKQDSRTTDNQDVKVLMALFSSQRSLALKRLFAEELEDIDGLTLALGGEQGSSLVEERNKVALAELRRQLAAGKHKIAVFYGGAHMPDVERRLTSDFGLSVRSVRWLVAWDMTTPPPGGKTEKPPAAAGK